MLPIGSVGDPNAVYIPPCTVELWTADTGEQMQRVGTALANEHLA